MPVYNAKGTTRFSSPEMGDTPHMSVGIQQPLDNSFDTVPVPMSVGGATSALAEGVSPPLFTEVPVTYTANTVSFLYGQVYGVDLSNSLIDTGKGISVDYGLLLKDEVQVFGLWNAFNIPKTISSISVTAGQGVSILSPTSGTVILPRQEILLELAISKEGGASLEAVVVVVIGDELITFSIKGLRISATYFLKMNWAGGSTTTRRFLTSVYQSGTSAETRKALRYVPIRELTIPITYFNKETAIQARATVQTCARIQYGMPVYQDLSISTGDSSTTKVFCDTSYRRFAEGGLAAVVHKGVGGFSTDHFDIMTIATVEEDGITGAVSLANSYVRGDLVYPMTVCTPCFDEIGHEVFNDRSGEYTINSVEVFGLGMELENSDYVPTTLRGIPVYPFAINYGEEVSSSFTAFGAFEDAGRGQKYYVASKPDVTYSATSLFDSREVWWEALGFFNYIKGQWRKFWYTEPIDLYDVADFYAPTRIDLTTSVSPLDFSFLTYLHLVDSSGEEQIVEVYSVDALENGVQLTVDEITIDTPVQLRTAKICRLAADDVEEAWLTDSVVTISFQLKELSQATLT